MITEQELQYINRIYEVYQVFLKKDIQDYNNSEREEFGTPFTICTNCAQWLINNFFPSGYIMGYQLEDNPTALVGKDCGGHDFLVVDKHLIDFWARGINSHKKYPIHLHIEKQSHLVKKYYGDINKWETLDKLKYSELCH